MIFVDTGAWLGRYVEGDQHHAEAVEAWKQLLETRKPIFTSSFVIDETATNLARMAGYEFAAGVTAGLLTDSQLRILRPDHIDELEAVKLFRRYASEKVSFTDCTSFVLMKRHKIKSAFSFDRHFRVAGFSIFPG